MGRASNESLRMFSETDETFSASEIRKARKKDRGPQQRKAQRQVRNRKAS